MAECTIRTINPSVFLKQGANGLEQMIRVAVSCSENIANAELTAECGGEIIGRQEYDLIARENNTKRAVGDVLTDALKCGEYQLKMKIIAKEYGFCDEFHMSKTFKKYTGVSPTEYKFKFIKSQ